MIHSIREICEPSALVLADWSGPLETYSEERWLRPLLGCLVNLVMQDGATKLALGVTRESHQPGMKFFGPRWYRQRIWWDMVPPKAYCYPTMHRVCLSMAKLDQSLPIKGMIPAVRQRKRLCLELTIDTIDSFQIAWDADYALDRAQSKPS